MWGMMNDTNINNDGATMAIALSAETVQACKDIATTLTETKVVRPVFMPHIADAQNDICGIQSLISDILTQAEAIFPRGIEATELRPIAVAASLTTQSILTEVERRFSAGTTRYPYQTVRNYLSVYGKGTFGQIALSNAEDSDRNNADNVAWRKAHGAKTGICLAPRSKWYLIDKD